MDRTSPPLKQLRLLFKAGLGARLGSGEQHFPMISLRDWIGAVSYLIESRDVSGPFNLCCPTTPTNAEFTRALARAVGRRAFFVAPAAVLRVAAGNMAPELLGSVNARPAALERARLRLRGRGRTRGAGGGARLIAHLLDQPVPPTRTRSIRRVEARSAGSRTVWPEPLARPPTMRSVTTTLSRSSARSSTASDNTCVRSPVTRRPRSA